jgi:protein translocase SecG subunit
MELIGWILIGIQIITALALVLIIATQTTKSEQGGTGMGWGTIGGQASSTVGKFGLEAQLTRLTTIIAVVFFVVSFLSAWVQASFK